MNDLLESDLPAAFAARLETVSPEREARLRAYDYHSRTGRRRTLVAALGASGSAVTGGIVAAVLLLSSGASIAYAGWTSVPTPATPSMITTVSDKCAHAFTGTDAAAIEGAFSGQPVLTETRDIYTAVVEVSDGKLSSCLSHGLGQPPGTGSHLSITSYGPIGRTPGADQISAPYKARGGFGEGSGQPGLVQNMANATPAQIIRLRALLRGGGYGPSALGQAGADVSAVSFTFTNGDTVSATVENGWYFAWWPWMSRPTSVSVTTDGGTVTSPVTSLGGFTTSSSRIVKPDQASACSCRPRQRRPALPPRR